LLSSDLTDAFGLTWFVNWILTSFLENHGR
jgi:hypothetical protein